MTDVVVDGELIELGTYLAVYKVALPLHTKPGTKERAFFKRKPDGMQIHVRVHINGVYHWLRFAVVDADEAQREVNMRLNLEMGEVKNGAESNDNEGHEDEGDSYQLREGERGRD